MWARWALAIAVGVAVIAGTAIAIHRAGPGGGTSEADVEAEDNRLADLAITEDEAPHFASLPQGSEPAAALQRAIARDVRQRIADRQVTGPLQKVTCSAAGTGSAGRGRYHCTVYSAGIAYPFQAVVDPRRQQLAWCKVDPPPVGTGPEIPLSPSCRG